jgi:hypothetical protein
MAMQGNIDIGVREIVLRREVAWERIYWRGYKISVMNVHVVLDHSVTRHHTCLPRRMCCNESTGTFACNKKIKHGCLTPHSVQEMYCVCVCESGCVGE